MMDEVVPYHTSLRVADKLISRDVMVSLVKEGDHRLSKSQELTLIFDSIEKLLFK